jgi:deoxycytidine triphosphate deaminase
MKLVPIIKNVIESLPANKDEAIQLAENSRLKDPLKDISPSLLNKYDIIKYVSKTGLIFPFKPKQLKSASYEVLLGTKALYWDEKKNKCEIEANNGDKIPLPKNSIIFVSLESSFYLPYYIAARFNLTITHVHRGILLGTGPLIDPGFYGDLMIPLHNLTNNDYELSPGEPLVAVEFTKLTIDPLLEYPSEHNLTLDDLSEWYSDNIKKKDYDFDKYFKNALPVGIGHVQSSISDTLNEIRLSQRKIQKLRNIAVVSLIAVILTLLFGIGTLIFNSISVVSDANRYISESMAIVKKDQSNEYDLRSFATEPELNVVKAEVQYLKNQFSNLKKAYPTIYLDSKITDLNNRLDKIQSELDTYFNKTSQ